jgi:hypothetical protein
MRYTRTQVYLDPDDHRRLVDEARARGISLAALIREIVSEFTRGRRRASSSFDSIIAIVKTGEPSDIARFQDEYMREALERRLAKKMGRDDTARKRARPQR